MGPIVRDGLTVYRNHTVAQIINRLERIRQLQETGVALATSNFSVSFDSEIRANDLLRNAIRWIIETLRLAVTRGLFQSDLALAFRRCRRLLFTAIEHNNTSSVYLQDGFELHINIRHRQLFRAIDAYIL